MLMFSRVSLLSGAPAEVAGAAIAITERVNEVVDSEVSLWAGGAGLPFGTTAWSMGIESHAALAEMAASLTGDAKYGELVGQLNQYRVGETNDQIQELVHGAPPDGPTPIGGAAWMVMAQISGGNTVNAMTFGAEITDYVTGLTGVQTRFLRGLYGPFGSVAWITTFDDVAGLDHAHAALAADNDYLSLVDKAGDYFVEGAANQAIATRIA